MLIVSIFDTPARWYFLNHTSQSGFFACTVCTIEGIRKDRYYQLFKPQTNIELRNMDNYEEVLNHKLPPKGVKGRCPNKYCIS